MIPAPHPQPTALLVEPENTAELAQYREALGRRFPQLTLLLAGSLDEAVQLAPDASMLLIKAHRASAALLAAMPRLEFIQSLTTGVDGILALPLPPAVTLCSARGIHGPQMSELAILQMLSLARDFPRMLRNQQQAQWQRWPQPLLTGKTVAIVGMGAVGVAIARQCRGFGMRVVGISNAVGAAAEVDEILPRAQLAAAAGRADFLVLVVPYAADTHHLVDAPLLRAMKPGAFLLNIARGPVVDTEALVVALRSGVIAGAALDVFDHEPLDPSSPLWSLPNVIITPHVGGLSDCYAQQLMPLIIDNLQAWISGDAPLRNLVSR